MAPNLNNHYPEFFEKYDPSVAAAPTLAPEDDEDNEGQEAADNLDPDAIDSSSDESFEDEQQEISTAGDRNDALFSPPLYLQRYHFAINCINSAISENIGIKSVIDMGCAECNFLKMMKTVDRVERLIGLDLDESLLDNCGDKLKPLVADFLVKRRSPLVVELYSGNLTSFDSRVSNVDVVVALELIEHLNETALEVFPQMVFGHIKPKMAIVSTPNVEYNRLFPDFEGPYRHPDHKFEWTRKEFESWVMDILDTFPQYTVRFDGVGHGGEEPRPEGPCTQIAVFNLKADHIIPDDQIEEKELYKTVRKFEYPVLEDLRTREEKLTDELAYYVRSLASDLVRHCEEFEDKDEIHISFESLLNMSTISQLETSPEELSSTLIKMNYRVTDNAVVVPKAEVEDQSCPVCSDVFGPSMDLDEFGFAICMCAESVTICASDITAPTVVDGTPSNLEDEEW